MAELTLLHLLLGTCTLVTLSLLLHAEPDSLTVLQPPEIRAEIGKPATLSCKLNFSDDRKIFVTFSKTREEERGDIGGIQSSTCSQLASKEKLFLCEVSLKTNNTRVEDEGVYYCKIRIPTPGKSFTGTGNGTKLSLYAEPSLVDIKHPHPLVSGHEASLICSASGFYPQYISVLWSHRGQQVPLSNVSFKTEENSDGTFQVLSELKFRPTAADQGVKSSCTISHPYWTTSRTASIPLNVAYGPSLVTVTTSPSTAMIRGSVHVEMGSQLKLACVADGNPKPSVKWLEENRNVVHTTETLHIPQVQKEQEGLYWCVVNNLYGEKNTSVHLLVSLSKESNPYMKLMYGFIVVLVALVTVIVIFTSWRRRKEKDAQDSEGHHPHSPIPFPEKIVQYEETEYAMPKKRKKKPHQPKPARQTVDETQLIYARITFTSAPSNVITTNESKMSIYSDVKRKHQTTEEQNGEGMHTIYAVAQHPL